MDNRALLAALVGLVFPILCGCTGEEHVFQPAGQELLGIDASFNLCPRITRVTTAPLQVGVGGYGLLHAEATDFDGNGDLSFAWSAKGIARIVKPTVADTRYECAVAGNDTLTLTVSDADGCSDVYRVAVTCAKAP